MAEASERTTTKSAHFRRRLIAGVIVIAPVTVTAVVLWWLFNLVDGLLGQFLYPWLPFPIPGLGLIMLLLLLFLVGWGAERALGSRLLAGWSTLLERIPLARRIYAAANSITRTMFGEQERPFKSVVLVEWPAEGRWSIGFLAGVAAGSMRRHVDDGVSVFIPTTPNPTTGFLTVVSRSKTITLDMTIDQAFTFILSAGAATPEGMPVAAARPGRAPAAYPAGSAHSPVSDPTVS
ncbi:MAG TPA: DUF502 domain-containing protein [Longimicrobiales bacterium]|nr:DUF502 domain-containing protein [Longimicrobiales bacterium]